MKRFFCSTALLGVVAFFAMTAPGRLVFARFFNPVREAVHEFLVGAPATETPLTPFEEFEKHQQDARVIERQFARAVAAFEKLLEKQRQHAQQSQAKAEAADAERKKLAHFVQALESPVPKAAAKPGPAPPEAKAASVTPPPEVWLPIGRILVPAGCKRFVYERIQMNSRTGALRLQTTHQPHSDLAQILWDEGALEAWSQLQR